MSHSTVNTIEAYMALSLHLLPRVVANVGGGNANVWIDEMQIATGPFRTAGNTPSPNGRLRPRAKLFLDVCARRMLREDDWKDPGSALAPSFLHETSPWSSVVLSRLAFVGCSITDLCTVFEESRTVQDTLCAGRTLDGRGRIIKVDSTCRYGPCSRAATHAANVFDSPATLQRAILYAYPCLSCIIG